MTGGSAADGSAESAARLTPGVVGWVLSFFLSSRLLIWAVAAFSRDQILRGPFAASGTVLAALTRWDAEWYLRIARSGYFYRADGESSVAFYPLYPLLVRLVHFGSGFSFVLSGYLVSNAALLAAAFVLWKLTARETGSTKAAAGAVAFLCFVPGSLWFSLVYSESVSVLATVVCLYAARRRRWLAAAAAGYLGALARTPGLLVALFLVVEAWQQWCDDYAPLSAPASRRWREAAPYWQDRRRTLLGVAGPLLGHVTYLTYLQLAFGDWRAQQKTYAAGWHLTVYANPWTAWNAHARIEEPFAWEVAGVHLAACAGLAAAAWMTCRRRGYFVLLGASTLLYVCATGYSAMPRYTAAVVPIYPVLGGLIARYPLLERPLFGFCVAGLGLLTVCLANGYLVN